MGRAEDDGCSYCGLGDTTEWDVLECEKWIEEPRRLIGLVGEIADLGRLMDLNVGEWKGTVPSYIRGVIAANERRRGMKGSEVTRFVRA